MKKGYVVLICLFFLVGFLIGIDVCKTKTITKTFYPTCDKCEKVVCSDCVCKAETTIINNTNIEICNEPSKYACKTGLKSVVSSINVRCNTGKIKVWDCNKGGWK